MCRSGFHWIAATAATDPTTFELNARWVSVALSVVAYAAVLTWMSGSFAYDVEVADMPCLPLVSLLVVAGAAYALVIPTLVTQSQRASVVTPPPRGYPI